MRSVFRDSALQAAFERDGYIVSGQLAPADLAEFQAHFAAVRPADISQMYSNVHDLPVEVNRAVGSMINRTLGPLVAEMCDDYVLKGGTYLVKGCGPDSVCKVHQDWNTVDESTFVGLVLWVPLVDVDRHNGCLVVAPGSHRADLFPTRRGANFETVHLDIDPDVEARVIDVPLRAGQVCLFAQNLFHGSWPNMTDQVRASLYAGAIPRDAQMLHYHRTDPETLAVIEIDEDFYYTGAAGRLAMGGALETSITGTVPSTPDVSRDEFLSGTPTVGLEPSRGA